MHRSGDPYPIGPYPQNMADKVSYKWSSNIGDWDGYWVDREFFEERYGEIEYGEDGLTSDGETLADIQSLDEETRFVEPPSFVDWLIRLQNFGFSIERVWIERYSGTDPSQGDMRGYMPHVAITQATVEVSINPEASDEQKAVLEPLMEGMKTFYDGSDLIDSDTGTVVGVPMNDEEMISDQGLTGEPEGPTVLQGEL